MVTQKLPEKKVTGSKPDPVVVTRFIRFGGGSVHNNGEEYSRG